MTTPDRANDNEVNAESNRINAADNKINAESNRFNAADNVQNAASNKVNAADNINNAANNETNAADNRVTYNELATLVTDVNSLVGTMRGQSEDLVVLTVEVESFRDDLSEAQTTFDAEARRRGFTLAFAATTVGAVQITSLQTEKCRIEPIINRFKHPNQGPGSIKEFVCDVSFPTNNHGPISNIDGSLSPANYLGISIYLVLAVAATAWYAKAKQTANKKRQEKAERERHSRQLAKKIYNGPSHSATKGLVDSLDDEEA